MTDLFAPPTEEEKNDLFAPPEQSDLFAPPSEEEKQAALFAPPKPHELTTESVTGENNTDAFGQVITDSDLQKIASKHGVSIDMLKARAGYYGGNYSPANGDIDDEFVEAGKSLAGKALNAVPFGLHKFIDKKLHDNPNERAALDDLNELVYNKSGKLDIAADIGTQALLTAGAGAIAKGGAGALTKVLAAIDSPVGIIGQGAVAGLNESKEGQELAGLGLGAALAGGLLGAGHIAGKIFKGGKVASEESKTLVKEAEEMIEGSDVLTDDNMLRATKAVQANPEIQALEKVVTNPEKLDSFTLFRSAEDMAPLRKTVQDEVPEVTEAVRDALIKNGVEPETITPQFVHYYKDWQTAREELVRFAQDKVSDSIKTYEQAASAVKELTAQEGQGAVGQYFKSYKIGQALKKEVAGKYAAYEPGVISRLFDKFWDNILVNRQIDRLYNGLGAEDLQKELSRHSDGYINVKHKILKGAKDAFRNMEQAVKEGLDIRKILDEKSEDQIAQTISALPATQQKAVTDFIKIMKSGLAEANADDVKLGINGLNIKELAEGKKGYVPHIAADTKDIILRMENKIAEANKELGLDLQRLSPEILAQTLENNLEKSKAVSDVAAGLRFLSRAEEPDPVLLKKTIDNFQNVSKTHSSKEINIAAAQTRKGGVPDFLLENDPVKLINKWHNNTFKGKYLKQDLYKLRQLGQTLRALGDTTNAEYTEKYISDLAGVRADTVATNIQNMKLAWDLNYQRKFNNAKTDGQRAYYKSLQLAPQLLGVMQAGMYPFYLGAKLSNVVRNLTQPLLTTSLEGASKAAPGYGLAKVFPAMMETYATLVNPKAYKSLVEEMRVKGLMPAEFDPQMIKWAREGVDDELAKTDLAPLLKLKDVGAFIDRTAMALYSASDEINRVVTYKTAKGIAADIAKGNEKALATLGMYPKSVQARFNDLAKTAGVDSAGDYLAQHLLATTQFNYNRASLNEFGRTFGSLFSAFTKWPAHVIGDVGYTVKEARGLYGKNPEQMMQAKQRLFYKYFAPFGVLALGDIATNVTEAKDDPLFELLAGKGSLTGFSPLASVNPLAQGRGISLVPPALQELGKTLVKSSQGEASLKDWLSVGAQGLPGGVTYQILSKHMADWDKAFNTDLQPEIFKRDYGE
jgi:hypothetical protein